MSEVANLITKLTVDDSEFKAKIAGAKTAIGGMGSAISNLAKVGAVAFTAITASVALFTHEVISSADKISKLVDNTDKLGITVAAFQELSIAAREAGVSSDSLQNLLAVMNRNLGKAALGSGEAGNALRALGLSLKDLQGLSVDQKMELIASKLRQVKDLSLETALASAIFGRGASEGIALFNSNIEESIAGVKELGLTLEQSSARGLDKLSETKDLLKDAFSGLKDNIAASFAPDIQKGLDALLQGIKNKGGIKAIAQDIAAFIKSAFSTIKSYLDTIADYGTRIKTLLEGIADSFIGKALKFAYTISSTLANLILKGGELVFNSSTSKEKSPSSLAGNATARLSSVLAENTPKTSKIESAGIASIAQQQLSTAKIIADYGNTTENAKKALEALKTAAMRSAEVLDSYSKIKNALAAPGNQQADDIINKSVKDLGIQLAPSEEFQSLFTQALKDGNSANTQTLIERLQDIIDREKNTTADVATSGFGSETAGPLQNVSGLVSALNELKSFLAGKNNKDQEVKVSIKVEASPDFITTVTKSTSFKDAVEKEFADTMSAAARGGLR